MSGDDGKAALRSFHERAAALLESHGTLDDVSRFEALYCLHSRFNLPPGLRSCRLIYRSGMRFSIH